jgi:DNA anti-recombination protein RmuC
MSVMTDKQLNARFDKIDQRFEKLDQRFEKFDERFEKFEQRFEASFTSLFNYMNKRFDEVDGRFTMIDKRFSDMQSVIDGIAKGLDDESLERHALQHKVGRHETWIHTLAHKTQTKLT